MKTILSVLLVAGLASVARGEFVEFEARYRWLHNYPPSYHHQWPVVAIGFDDANTGVCCGDISSAFDGAYLEIWQNGELIHETDREKHLLYRSAGLSNGPTQNNPSGRATVMFTTNNPDWRVKQQFSATLKQYQIADPWTDSSLSEMYTTAFPSNLDNGGWHQPTFTYWNGERHWFDEPYKLQRVGTMIGDSNFDGQFDFDDILTVLAPGKFETGQRALWSQGDWDRDGFFAFEDILHVLGNVGMPGSHAAIGVPEPTTLVLLLIGLLALQKRQHFTR